MSKSFNFTEFIVDVRRDSRKTVDDVVGGTMVDLVAAMARDRVNVLSAELAFVDKDSFANPVNAYFITMEFQYQAPISNTPTWRKFTYLYHQNNDAYWTAVAYGYALALKAKEQLERE